MNKIILHVEGLAVLLLSVYFYFDMGYSWILFIILLLSPDISMLGYLKDNKFGAILYNIFHTYFIPIGVIFCGILIHNDVLLMLSLIWVAHIGMDRMVGYGLKYPTHFKDSHLNRI